MLRTYEHRHEFCLCALQGTGRWANTSFCVFHAELKQNPDTWRGLCWVSSQNSHSSFSRSQNDILFTLTLSWLFELKLSVCVAYFYMHTVCVLIINNELAFTALYFCHAVRQLFSFVSEYIKLPAAAYQPSLWILSLHCCPHCQFNQMPSEDVWRLEVINIAQLHITVIANILLLLSIMIFFYVPYFVP